MNLKVELELLINRAVCSLLYVCNHLLSFACICSYLQSFAGFADDLLSFAGVCKSLQGVCKLGFLASRFLINENFRKRSDSLCFSFNVDRYVLHTLHTCIYPYTYDIQDLAGMSLLMLS